MIELFSSFLCILTQISTEHPSLLTRSLPGKTSMTNPQAAIFYYSPPIELGLGLCQPTNENHPEIAVISSSTGEVL